MSLSADTEFSLSLNGSELLTDTGQTLASCGIVSGDLICVVLPESAAVNTATDKNDASTPSGSAEVQRTEPGTQTATNQVSDGNIQVPACCSVKNVTRCQLDSAHLVLSHGSVTWLPHETQLTQ